ncbi:hypothetical protein QBC34DRAFT_415773 [Podospora aff. communis PSN243]|uniref:Uncharacterized protein n=1 Tax=Podospora aff. communis PSN243 TaxID=3040156 RepID=A0AAV9G7S8_9PEZI|nr:hypothetical protein QBC34DRAFT_415773 [Podospora aff. communis PSN243]
MLCISPRRRSGIRSSLIGAEFLPQGLPYDFPVRADRIDSYLMRKTPLAPSTSGSEKHAPWKLDDGAKWARQTGKSPNLMRRRGTPVLPPPPVHTSVEELLVPINRPLWRNDALSLPRVTIFPVSVIRFRGSPSFPRYLRRLVPNQRQRLNQPLRMPTASLPANSSSCTSNSPRHLLSRGKSHTYRPVTRRGRVRPHLRTQLRPGLKMHCPTFRGLGVHHAVRMLKRI